MLPTLVLSTLLSLASPGVAEPRLQATSLVTSLEVAALETAGVPEDDGFESDRSGFPLRRATPAPAEAASSVTHAFGLARTLVGVWLAASALFGIVWGLLGWATGGRRIAARA